MPGFSKELTAMRKAGREAVRVIQQYRRNGFSLKFKLEANNSIVTEADVAAEKAIKRVLGNAFPTHGFMGEEDGTDGSTDKRFIIDPIDQTNSFSRDIPDYGPLIALEVDGRVVAGVMEFVQLGESYLASKGHGAFCSVRGAPAKRLRVSSVKRFADATVAFDHVWRNIDYARTSRFIQAARIPRAIGENIAFALLASGRADVVTSPLWDPWDIAAPKIIIEEAGGTFTNQRGEDTIYGKSRYRHSQRQADWFVASNGHLHEQALALTRKR